MNKPDMTEGSLKRGLSCTKKKGYCNESFVINLPKTFKSSLDTCDRLFLYRAIDLEFSNDLSVFWVIPERIVLGYINESSLNSKQKRLLLNPLKIFNAGCRELRYVDNGIFTIIDLEYNNFNWNIINHGILELRGYNL